MGRLFCIPAWLCPALLLVVLLVDGSGYGATVSTIRGDPDLDRNGIVDGLDFEIIAHNWLWRVQAQENAADLDRDGTVDFNDFGVLAGRWLSKRHSVAIFIDSNSYSSLQAEIERLRSDIANDLEVPVFVFADNWRTIESIKNILIDTYIRDGLLGAILIGEIPTAYFEYQDSGAAPTDWYFQDLSDEFIDADGDGKFEREHYLWETDVTMREIWTGRIKPPLGRLEGIEMLRAYLDRNHRYRTGDLRYDKKMLYFGSIAINQTGVSEHDYFGIVNQIDDYTGLYESDADVNAIYEPCLPVQKSMYLSELSYSYDFAFVNIHGSATTQWLGDSTSVYHNEIRDARPEALFTVLASCSNGDFTQENYFAGWYLFSGNSLVVTGNSVVAMLVGSSSVEFLEDYNPLGLGVTFGQMYKNDQSFMVSHLFGDPTLTLRAKPTGEQPLLCVDTSHLDFPDTHRGTKTAKYIWLENNGTATLTLNFKKGPFSIDGESVNLGYWDVFYYRNPDTGELFRDFAVPAGEKKRVSFVFYPRADAPTGRYSMTILFQTNDPENPYLQITLAGNAT
ncbi:MAG: hypothetical protein JSU70_17015 [Phycisphaerales bacterium]|nr:MAG: hypothetical protein JSU70_17015 [Phycisphaerales bacterium]